MPPSLNLSLKVARWTIRNLQGRDGHFFYRIYPMMKAKTPMLHWAQGTIYKALAVLLHQLRGNFAPATPSLATTRR